MQRIQLQQRLKLQILNCFLCKKQSPVYYNLLSQQNKIICYQCIKNNQQHLKQIKSSFRQHYQNIFNQIPLPDIKIAKQLISQLQRMKQTSDKLIQQYRQSLLRLQQQIQQFYMQTKIICNSYIDKINILIEKSNKSINQLIQHMDIINQKKYIKNLKQKHKISIKIQQQLKRLKPQTLSIKQLQTKQQQQISRMTICDMPIQTVIQIKGNLYFGTTDGRIIYQYSLQQLKYIKAHQSLIRSFAYDGQYKLYSGSDDFKIKVWDLHNGDMKFIGQFGSIQGCKSYHRNIVLFNHGKTLASTRGQFDGFKIRIWDLVSNTYKNIKQLEGHEDYITAMTINSSEQLITVSQDKTLKIWNPLSKSSSYHRIFYHNHKLNNVFSNHQRNLISIVDQQNKIIILDDQSLNIINAWNIGRKILCSYAKNLLYFALATIILVYDWNGNKIYQFSLDKNFLPAVLLEIDNRLLVCDGKGKTIQIPIKNNILNLQ